MSSNRRQFIKTLAASAAGANLISSQTSVTAEEAFSPKNPFSTDPLARVKLFGDVETSRIGFGTGMSGYNHSAQLTRMDRDKAVKLINHCYDSGVRFFDCADLYGTHEIISTTLKDKPRDSYVISSKLWPHPGGIEDKDRPDAVTVVKRFLRELKTDYLDLVQIHCMTKPDWADDCKQYMEDLEKCKEQGLIRGHGVSTHSIGSLQTAAENPWVDAVHIRLNSAGTRMDGTFEENVAASRKAQENGKGVICMKLVGEGTMKELEERRHSIDTVVRSQVVDVYIVGFEECWQVDELIENIGLSLKAMEAEQKG
ncbi:MAG: aldo/keto reductase [Thermoguttaceae bacterium]|nr:aldo/keto reductase [Thermoguttaceae bacterium]